MTRARQQQQTHKARKAKARAKHATGVALGQRRANRFKRIDRQYW